MSTNAPLLFQTPNFHPGVNVTIRKGAKWFGRLGVGDIVEIKTTPTEDPPEANLSHGYHLILGAVFCDSLDEIEGDLLKFQHDPTCRTDEGLADEMENIYGSDNDEGFTVLVFYYSPNITVDPSL